MSDNANTGTGDNDAGGLDDTNNANGGAPAGGNPAAGKPGEPNGGKPAEQDDAGAVEYKLDVPEGMELDKASLEQFTEIAKTHKLPKDAFEALGKIAIAREEARAEAYKEQVAKWESEVKADPEVGGEKLAENLVGVRALVEEFGGPDGGKELKELLNATGMGNHPLLFKFCQRVSKALGEDRLARGQGNPAANTEEARLRRMYPSAYADAKH